MLQTAAGHVPCFRQPVTEGPAWVVLGERSSVVGLESQQVVEGPLWGPIPCRRAVGGWLSSTALLCCPVLFAGWPSPPSSIGGCWLWDTTTASALCFSKGSHLPPVNCGSSPQHWEPGYARSPRRNLAADSHVPSLLSSPVPTGEHSCRGGSVRASMKHIWMCDGCEAALLLPWHAKITVQTIVSSAVLISAALYHASRKKIQQQGQVVLQHR